MIPLMVFVVMLGNVGLVAFAYLARKKSMIPCLLAGAIAKAGVLWVLVWYAVLPFFGANAPEPAKISIKATFSLTQLITALIGCAVAYVVHLRIKQFYITEK